MLVLKHSIPGGSIGNAYIAWPTRSAQKRLRFSIGSVYSDPQRSRTRILLQLIIYSFSSKNRFADSYTRLNASELNAHSDR